MSYVAVIEQAARDAAAAVLAQALARIDVLEGIVEELQGKVANVAPVKVTREEPQSSAEAPAPAESKRPTGRPRGTTAAAGAAKGEGSAKG